MKQLHAPKDSLKYTKGANFDVHKEFLTIGDGQYIDARNMRNLSMDGDNAAMKKIGGEVMLYPNINNRCDNGDDAPMASTYICIGSVVVNGNIVEFWADSENVLEPYIRINGKIALQHADFPILADFPLQIESNESCIGGEIYITDFNSEPMIFNVQDIIENSGLVDGIIAYDCTDKYFTDFNINLYILSLSRALNHPVFIKLDASTGGYTDILYGEGLPVGYVTYSFRYATTGGDRSSWSAPTNQIPVVKRLTSGSEPNFPYLQTISKPADISVPSVYGAHIKLRVDNISGYDFIELRRDSWYAENPLGNPPVIEIIAKINVDSGELSVRDILDRGKEAEEVVSGDELIEVIASIKRAKTVRYFNNTLYLMNVEYQSRNIADTLTYSGGNDKMYPVIRNMHRAGHGNPTNGAHYKSLMRGERYGWGLILWDGQGNYSFSDKIDGFEDFEMPNRRDGVSTLTDEISYYGVSRAAKTTGTIGLTHEVFDLINATSRTYFDALGKVNVGTANAQQYAPFTPTGQDDVNNSHLNLNPNVTVANSAAAITYEPVGFSPRYYSMGMALAGVSGFPAWAKAFSVVRTLPANKVEAQGLGFYSLRTADGAFGANTSKDPYALWVYLPDADDNHGINNNLYDAIVSDTSAFSLQLVSPLGFFTEIFSFDDAVLGDNLTDMVVWCRLLNDAVGGAARINPDENANMGFLDVLTGENFVVYGKWRASTQFSPQYPLGANGNFEYDIDTITEVTDGRSKYLEITTVQPIYQEEYTNGAFQGDDTDVQDWHEPVYMVNILKVNATVPDSNSTQYTYCGNYVKIDGLIGISEYDDNNSYDLVDERWEDCIQISDNDNGGSFSNLFRFAYIEDSSGLKRRWVNVTEFTAPTIDVILTALDTFGVTTVTDPSGVYNVYGVYTSVETADGVASTFKLDFDYFDVTHDKIYQVPLLGESIYVSYDDRIPVRVFGGDSWIGDTACAFLDKEYNKNANPATAGDLFKLNVAFPYREHDLNIWIDIIKGTVFGSIQINTTFKFQNGAGLASAQIRQLVANFIVESRINLNYAFNNEDPKHSSEQWFPLKNYVMRPNKWDDGKFAAEDAIDVYDDNKIHSDEYFADYGDEYLLWQYGGFRFINLATSVPLINLDYSQYDNTKLFSSTPKLGYEEQNYYCTRVHWSVKRPSNIQDSPTVRTFPSSNTYDISDDSGEIKFAYSAISAKGNNIYAFTEGGICLLLVDKRIISEINANELATVGSDIGGVLNELWISRTIGLSGETWRSVAEYDNSMWFVNHKSAYKFADNGLGDIGRTGYHSKIYGYFLSDMTETYSKGLTAAYDELHGEYWVNFTEFTVPDGVIDAPTLSFGNLQEMWGGGYDYDFFQYESIDNVMYGIKQDGTYILNSGNTINGADIISELVGATVGDIAYENKAPVDNKQMDKEFIRIRVNSNFEPTSVDFYDDFEQYKNSQVQATIDNVANVLAMKDYRGHEGYIPRKTTFPHERMQGRLLIYNIINIFDEDFKITTTDIQYKKLK